MVQTKIYKINLLLLLALCLGYTSTLYAAQNDEVDDEKEPIGDSKKANKHCWQSKPMISIQQDQNLKKKAAQHNNDKAKKLAYPNISLDILGKHFGKHSIFEIWHQYMLANDIDTDCLLEEIAIDESDSILYDKIDRAVFIKIKNILTATDWSCAKCTFINKANSKSCAMCTTKKLCPAEDKIAIWSCAKCTLKNTIKHTKCVACGTSNPAWVRHKKKQPTKHKPASDSRINLNFIKLKAKSSNSSALYRFKFTLNNTPCEVRHTYNSLYAIHKDIIKTYKEEGKRLVFPTENISKNYLKCGKELQLYLRSLFSIYHQTKRERILGRLGIWICDICKIPNSKNKTCIRCKSAQLTINVKRRYGGFFGPLYRLLYASPISIAYAKDISLSDVLDKAIQYINQEEEESGYTYFIKSIGSSSFVGKIVENKIASTANHEWDAVVKQTITTWHKDEIIKKGLEIYIAHIYYHAPSSTKITCPYIKDADPSKYSGLALALQCPIYSKNDIVNEEVRKHLHSCSHFWDEYSTKAVCEHGAACKSFIRLENNSNSVNDLCHIKLYRHPPRYNRQITLAKNIHQFICHQNKNNSKPLYAPTSKEKKNLLRLLLDEVIKHKYQYDLCLICKQGDKCQHNVYQRRNKKNLISIVEDKFNHPRYKQMGRPFHSIFRPNAESDAFMLSLILYTGCDCSYDMCKSQRDRDYNKWKIFDLCLWNAIHCLSQKEYGAYKLYSALKNTKIPARYIRSGYFPTYISTTAYKDIATRFLKGQGMMIQIDQAVRNAFICCDVSWISKFPDEYEVLIARTPKRASSYPVNNFFVKILDDKPNVQTVLFTQRPSYDLACEDIMAKISRIIGARSLDNSKLPSALVVPIFKQLVDGAKEVPYQASKKWDVFRHKQRSITISMPYMYAHYKAFMPLFFDMKCKNVLLLDNIVQLFPNVTKVICTKTDCKSTDKYGGPKCASAIVNSNFMLAVKERLSKIDKHAKLTKVIIQTWRHKIGDKCKLYAPQFGALGWYIGKEGKTIALTKNPYSATMLKILSMLEAKKPTDEVTSLEKYEVPSLYLAICSKLIARGKDVPYDMQQLWDKLRHQPQRITINIHYNNYYKAFIPLFFDMKYKNVLLLDNIASGFPNVTEIICKSADYDGDKRCFSADIVSSNFILGLKERLSNMDKQAKLTKIVIETAGYAMRDDCKLYAPQFGTLGWQIGRGCKTIVLTKELYGVRCKDVIVKIKSMIRATMPSYEPTSLDVPILNELILGEKDIPSDVQQIWNKFRYQQQSIKIRKQYMYAYYKAYMPLLFDPKLKHVLLLDRIVRLFPNVTEIICEATDGASAKYNDYSADIVSSKFMLGVRNRLRKMDKHAKLTKIIIQTKKYEIKHNCKLSAPQFSALGWQIDKGAYDNKWGAAKKHNQITLTRLQAPKASFTNSPPASLDTNENKHNDHYSVDNEVFDID